jgi:uncharacterized metal-binding protein YceD (DUF177 family)
MPEQLSLAALIEEQVLLALPLVPAHEAGSPQCRSTAADIVPLAPAAARVAATADAVAAETQTPFANLRDMLGKNDER